PRGPFPHLADHLRAAGPSPAGEGSRGGSRPARAHRSHGAPGARRRARHRLRHAARARRDRDRLRPQRAGHRRDPGGGPHRPAAPARRPRRAVRLRDPGRGHQRRAPFARHPHRDPHRGGLREHRGRRRRHPPGGRALRPARPRGPRGAGRGPSRGPLERDRHPPRRPDGAGAMIRLVVADDQATLRSGLVALLGLEPDVEVVAAAAAGASTRAAVAARRPDVLALAVQVPAGTGAGGTPGPADGIAVAEPLQGQQGAPRIIVLTTFGRAGYLRSTMEAGAAGFMVKDTPVEQLVDAIRRVDQGLRVVDPELAAQSLAVGSSPLTLKETEVLQAAAAGGTTARIAEALFLSEGTVRNHISSVIGKLGVTNRAEPVRAAAENGWI